MANDEEIQGHSEKYFKFLIFKINDIKYALKEMADRLNATVDEYVVDVKKIEYNVNGDE